MQKEQTTIVNARTRRCAERILARFGPCLHADEATAVVQIILAHRHHEPISRGLIETLRRIEGARGE